MVTNQPTTSPASQCHRHVATHAHTPLSQQQDARNRGMDRLVLLTTRTADWFMQRDFKLAGPAWSSELLPPSRRAAVNPARNSQLYYKDLAPLSDEERTEPGTRIGF